MLPSSHRPNTWQERGRIRRKRSPIITGRFHDHRSHRLLDQKNTHYAHLGVTVVVSEFLL